MSTDMEYVPTREEIKAMKHMQHRQAIYSARIGKRKLHRAQLKLLKARFTS